VSTTIIGTGHDLPGDILTNHAIEATTDDFDRARSACSLDEWVTGRIGIRSRRRVAPGEGTAHMATRAVARALADARVAPADVDLLVLSTFTSDYRLPQSVSLVQAELGMTAKCIQLEAACAGFVDGVLVASGLLDTLGLRTAVVVHSETMSSVMDPRQFLLSSIFGDGAGAVVLRDDPTGCTGVQAHCTGTDGTKAFWLEAGGGALSPVTPERWLDRSHFMTFDHKAIFGFAVEKMAASCRALLAASDTTVDDIDWVIAHQTGVNIITAVADELGIPRERFLVTLEHTGNTSGATIPIALDTFRRNGVLQAGDHLLLPAVGAGMAWGALHVVWADLPAPADVPGAAAAEPVIDLTDRDDRTGRPPGAGAPSPSVPLATGSPRP
jgi:3-oxoacyl-[acyl-carrier-protein] synthase-3